MKANKENCVKGTKVIKNDNWRWDDQGKNAVYGIVTGIFINKQSVGGPAQWAQVRWIGENGQNLDINSYQIEGDYHDLLIYEPYSMEDLEKNLEKLENKLKLNL